MVLTFEGSIYFHKLLKLSKSTYFYQYIILFKNLSYCNLGTDSLSQLHSEPTGRKTGETHLCALCKVLLAFTLVNKYQTSKRWQTAILLSRAYLIQPIFKGRIFIRI